VILSRDADWSWSPAPDASIAVRNGRDPGERTIVDPTGPVRDVWADSRSVDVPSNHAAQINRLVDDLLAGRRHETTLSTIRPTMELVTALYASSLTGAVGKGSAARALPANASAMAAPAKNFFRSIIDGLSDQRNTCTDFSSVYE